MSISTTFPTSVRQALEAADRLNVTIDPELRCEIENKLGLIKTAGELTFSGATVAEAVNDALAADRDPASDPAVRDAYFRAELRNLQGRDQLTEVARMRLYRTVTHDIDALVESFKDSYDTAGERMAAAHAIITRHGIADLADHRIMSSGLEVARANVEAREALDTLHAIDTALRMLLASSGLANGSPIGNVVRTVDTRHTSADDIRRLGKNITAWEAITAGFTISLATPTETQERVQRADDIVRAREAHAEEQARHMFGNRPSLLPATV